jgi:ammonium transporter, Amt family
LAACGGGIAWTLLEYLEHRKFSILGFCSGIIAGLVGITPAAGYIPVYVAALVGALTSCCSHLVVKYKHLLRVDEGLDIFAIHGIGGFVGDILTGFFADKAVVALDGVNNTYEGGWWNHHWQQMGYQLAAACTCAVWSFVVSIILLFVINKIPGLHLRATEEEELRGLDFKYLMDVDPEGDIFMLSGFGSVTPGVSGGASQEGVEVPITATKRD